MSRRGRIAKRLPSPDPIYNSVLATRFINVMMIEGKKTLAERIERWLDTIMALSRQDDSRTELIDMDRGMRNDIESTKRTLLLLRELCVDVGGMFDSIGLASRLLDSTQERFLDVVDEASREACHIRHAQSVRGHMTALSQKAYWDQFDASPDFVAMFVPGDGFLAAALDRLPDLMTEAMANAWLAFARNGVQPHGGRREVGGHGELSPRVRRCVTRPGRRSARSCPRRRSGPRCGRRTRSAPSASAPAFAPACRVARAASG